MTDLAMRFAEEAERLVGVPYRLHGRSPAAGLDCVGLAIAALKNCGRPVADRSGYSLRISNLSELFDLARKCGFRPACGSTVPGDVYCVKPGPAQAHIVIADRSLRFLHAHAGLGRVVSQESLPDWPILAHWRLFTEPE